MSLKGSLETIALPEVLQLLADTGKSGELLISGTRDGGRLWFDAGLLSGFEVGSSPDPADALFQLLRVDAGEFSFDTDAAMDERARTPDGGAEDVRPALETAQARMAEWVQIVSVVPSLNHRVTLVEASPRDEVVLDRFQWSLLVAVGEGHPVQHVLDRRGLPEFDGCKALKGLVDAALVEVSDPVSSEAPAVKEVEADDTADAGDPALLHADAGGYQPAVVEEHTPEYRYEPAPDVDDSPEADHSPEAAVDQPVAEAPSPDEQVVEDPAVDAHDGAEAHDVPVVEAADDPAAYAGLPETNSAVPVSEVGAVDGDAPAEGSEEPASDGREAMRALLAELSPEFEEPGAAPVSEPVDGLMDRGPWTPSELEQMSGWQRADGRDMIAWPDDERASDPVAASADDSSSAFHPGSSFDAEVESHDGAQAGSYQLADFGFPLRSEAAATEDGTSQHDGSAPSHAVADEQGAYETEPEEEPEQEPAEEPMNRGLLLKFLSSVRN